MTPNKTFFIGAGLALWIPLLLSFVRSLSVRTPGVPGSQLFTVLLLILATLLLGMLIGRTATVEAR